MKYHCHYLIRIMSSRSYSKSCGRKLNSATTCSIQFDEFFQGNQSRPSAAKSAGTIGKWGITSFTSIRSSDISGRRNGDVRRSHGLKRLKRDVGCKTSKKQTIAAPICNEDPHSMMNKPKKFFKSRNLHTSVDKPCDRDIRPIKSQTEQVSQSASSEMRFCDIIESVAGIPSRKGVKPPIVLRICKGTSKLVSVDDLEIHSAIDSDTVSNYQMDDEETSQTPGSRDNFSAIDNETLHLPGSTDSGNDTRMRKTRSRKKISYGKIILGNEVLEVPPPVTESQNESKNLVSFHPEDSANKDSLELSIENPVVVPSPIDVSSHVSREQWSSSDRQPGSHKSVLRTNIQSSPNDARPNSDEPRISSYIAIQSHSIRKFEGDLSFVDSFPTPIIAEQAVVYRQSNDFEDAQNQSDSDVRGRNVIDKDVEEECSSHSDGSESVDFSRNDVQTGSSVSILELNECSARDNQSTFPSSMAKKGSIFKTRHTGTLFASKRRALYKHKWSDGERESRVVDEISNKNHVACAMGFVDDPGSCVREIRSGDPHPSQSSSRKDVVPEDSEYREHVVQNARLGDKEKEYYTVIKNVKKAHQIQESGEFQEFNDDIEYILDTLRENNPNATRCLSAFRLASKCMVPAFRMHVRAHGTVAKFFKALRDATTDQSLALCTATVMFVLSQDRLAMDLDRDCLELMLSLLESDTSHGDASDDHSTKQAELSKNVEKAKQLCGEIQAQGHAKHLSLDNISVGQLAMETLLSLTSKRAGEWFKEELRKLGGLEHIIRTITDCYRYVCSLNLSHISWDNSTTDQLSKVCRCLRVLENVTHMNEQNQVYLLEYSSNILIVNLSSFLSVCCYGILKYPVFDINDRTSDGVVIRECLFSIIKVMINLTHRFNEESFGGKILGSQDRIMQTILFLLLRAPESVPEGKRFDIMMLTLILLINITEKCDNNKKLLLMSHISTDRDPGNCTNEKAGLDAIIELFYEQEELARAEEQKTDAILDGTKDSDSAENLSKNVKSQEEYIEETVTKLLQKAGQHMEHTFIAAYVGLLLGYLIMDDEVYEDLVKNKLPDGTFETIISVLKKFFNFMNLTASNEISSCGIAATGKVINFLEGAESRSAANRIDKSQSQ